MQTFENKLSFFKEKEVTADSLHKFVLQKMNNQVVTERRKVLAKRSSLRKAPAKGDCISSSLCDEAVSCSHLRQAWNVQ